MARPQNDFFTLDDPILAWYPNRWSPRLLSLVLVLFVVSMAFTWLLVAVGVVGVAADPLALAAGGLVILGIIGWTALRHLVV